MIRELRPQLAIVLLLLAGCQPPERFAADDLVGSWKMEGAGYVIEFREDGTYNVGASEFGLYKLDGNLLSLKIDDEASFCPRTAATYEIELTEEGKIRWTLVEDECSPRGAVANNSLWAPTLP